MRSNVEANEEPVNPINVSLTAFNAGVPISGTEEANSLHGVGHGHRELQVVDHSADLVVDLGLGPVFDFGAGPIFNQIGQACESDPISSWVGSQVARSKQRNETHTPSNNLGGGSPTATKRGEGPGSERGFIQGMGNTVGACVEVIRGNIEDAMSKDTANATIPAKTTRPKAGKNGVNNGGKYRCKIPKGLNKQGIALAVNKKQARRTISKRTTTRTPGNSLPSCSSSPFISN